EIERFALEHVRTVGRDRLATRVGLSCELLSVRACRGSQDHCSVSNIGCVIASRPVKPAVIDTSVIVWPARPAGTTADTAQIPCGSRLPRPTSRKSGVESKPATKSAATLPAGPPLEVRSTV